MKVLKTQLTSQAWHGRISLQVPEIVISFDGSEPEEIDAPDEWFVRLSHDIPSRQGFLFLSRKGWEANRDELWAAFEKANQEFALENRVENRVTREQYEAEIEKQLRIREIRVEKKIYSLKRKIAELEGTAL